jgi:hypothetical protein
VVEEKDKAKKGKGKKGLAAPTDPNQPQFVGPRGQQIPK